MGLGFEDDDGFRVFFLVCHVMMSSTCWNWRNKGRGDAQELYSKTISSFVLGYFVVSHLHVHADSILCWLAPIEKNCHSQSQESLKQVFVTASLS